MDVNGTFLLELESIEHIQASLLIVFPSPGLSDPYTRIFLDSVQEAKTHTIDKTLNPVWNETFCLYVPIHRSAWIHQNFAVSIDLSSSNVLFCVVLFLLVRRLLFSKFGTRISPLQVREEHVV